MLKREIEIDGKMVPFRASATVPRLYRLKFRRDIFKDILALDNARKKAEADGDGYGIESLEVFENVAYIMAWHADNSQPDTAEEWLDQFDTFSIYKVLPEILKLWNMNTEQQSKSKKNMEKLNAK